VTVRQHYARGATILGTVIPLSSPHAKGFKVNGMMVRTSLHLERSAISPSRRAQICEPSPCLSPCARNSPVGIRFAALHTRAIRVRKTKPCTRSDDLRRYRPALPTARYCPRRVSKGRDDNSEHRRTLSTFLPRRHVTLTCGYILLPTPECTQWESDLLSSTSERHVSVRQHYARGATTFVTTILLFPPHGRGF
jgi:hypothetical protein